MQAPPIHKRLIHAGGAAAVLDVVLLLFGGGSAALTARFLTGAESGVAEVLSSREYGGARSKAWTTTFSLVTPDGARLTASWTGERGFAPSSAVPVVYRRAPIARIQPAGHWATWGWA